MKNCKSGSFQLNFLLPVLAFFEGGSQSSWSWWDVILGRPLSSHITLVSHPPWWTNTNITLKLLDHVSLTVSPRLFTRNYQMMTTGHHGIGWDLLWVWCSTRSQDHNCGNGQIWRFCHEQFYSRDFGVLFASEYFLNLIVVPASICLFHRDGQ